MAILIKDMEMPSECHGCKWFYFQGTSCSEPRYYLDARCELVESGQDWWGKDSRGGWIGESIEHIPGWAGYYSHKHCVEEGTRASQCPLCELPSAQPEQHHDEWCTDCKEYDKEKHCCPRFNRVIRTAMGDASRWVPCSERLPEEGKDVLISADSWLYIAHLEIIDGEECWTEIIESLYIHDVDAWMPLPEPYYMNADREGE